MMSFCLTNVAINTVTEVNFVNREILTIIKQRNNAYRRFKLTNNEDDWLKYKRL